jgi:hypothetical protein
MAHVVRQHSVKLMAEMLPLALFQIESYEKVSENY